MNVVHYKIKTDLHSDYMIALVSDLHGRPAKDVVSSVSKEKPDIIAIAGDLVDTHLQDNQTIIDFLWSCVNISYTALSLGNHDFMMDSEDFKLIKEIGIHLYNDSYERFNSEIVIGGLTSSFYHKCEHYDPRIPMELFPEIGWLDDFEKTEGYKILLDHHPENYESYTKQRNIDLILSGHNHGGQIRLFGKGLYARNQGFFPKYDGGIYDGKLVVSRGLSNTMPIPRLWNPTELVYVELRKQKEPCMK